MIRAYMRDIRAAQLCSSGARRWFEIYNLSWTDHLANGTPVDILEATGDELALRVCAVARARAGAEEAEG